MSIWSHLSDVIAGRVAVGASSQVGRIFLKCKTCDRVVPQWNLVQERNAGERVGCVCGGVDVRPTNIPEWRAAMWWLYGLIWRKVILRKRQWDPRLPWQITPMP